jgi:bifunctional non-homologous end joining protein LigD
VVRELPVSPKKVEAMMKTDGKEQGKNGGKTKSRPKPTKSDQSENAKDSIAGVTLTHSDKVLYPEGGTTKWDVAEYYQSVQEWMLPHVVQRPLALVRCPGGLAAKCFFQRNWSDTLPPAVGKIDIGGGKKKEFHVTIDDLAGVISLTQISVLEIHTWNCRNDDIERSDQLIFDLDPGPDLPWKRVIEGARLLKSTLDFLRLPAFLKASGGKGLHITIPIKANIDWDSAKSFCQTIAKSLVEKSDLFVANMRKDLRGGKVYIDYNRNGRSATAVAPYSTRARAGAAVAMPISWEELGTLKSGDYFKVGMVSRYLDKRKKDPWRDFEKSRVDLNKVIVQKSAA